MLFGLSSVVGTTYHLPESPFESKSMSGRINVMTAFEYSVAESLSKRQKFPVPFSVCRESWTPLSSGWQRRRDGLPGQAFASVRLLANEQTIQTNFLSVCYKDKGKLDASGFFKHPEP